MLKLNTQCVIFGCAATNFIRITAFAACFSKVLKLFPAPSLPPFNTDWADRSSRYMSKRVNRRECITLSIKVSLQVRQFFCFWKLFGALNNCAIFLRSDKPERLYWTSKLSIWSYFGVRLCSRPLKHEDPWKSGTKNDGESVT